MVEDEPPDDEVVVHDECSKLVPQLLQVLILLSLVLVVQGEQQIQPRVQHEAIQVLIPLLHYEVEDDEQTLPLHDLMDEVDEVMQAHDEQTLLLVYELYDKGIIDEYIVIVRQHIEAVEDDEQTMHDKIEHEQQVEIDEREKHHLYLEHQ